MTLGAAIAIYGNANATAWHWVIQPTPVPATTDAKGREAVDSLVSELFSSKKEARAELSFRSINTVIDKNDIEVLRILLTSQNAAEKATEYLKELETQRKLRCRVDKNEGRGVGIVASVCGGSLLNFSTEEKIDENEIVAAERFLSDILRCLIFCVVFQMRLESAQFPNFL